MKRNEKIEFFNRCALTWDEDHKTDLSLLIAKIIKIARIQKGEKVLDAGCGTGILLPFLKEATGKNGEVVGLDFSNNMLKRAQKKFGKEFRYIQADIEDTPLEDSYFDKIVIFNSFPHFSDKENALREMGRVLKPGGGLLIVHSESRKRVNAFHRKIGGAVKSDILPNNKKMFELLKKTDFVRVKISDGQNFYWLSATKKKRL